MFESGLSMKKIGVVFGISRQRVHQIIRKAREKPKKSDFLTRAHLQPIIRLYQSGLSMREIGARFGVTAQRVEQILKQAGVKKRKFTRSSKFLDAKKEKRTILPKDLLVKYYKHEKLPVTEILRRLKISRSLFYKNLQYHHIATRAAEGNHRSPLTDIVLRQLYSERGMTAKEIARRFGYATVTVKKRLSKLGIRKTANKSRANSDF